MTDGDSETTIVAVHGIGPTAPGQTIRALLDQEALTGRLAVFDRVIVDGAAYERARVEDGPTVIEANWSDLRPIAGGPFKLVLEIVAVLTAMLQISQWPSFPGVQHRSFFFAAQYRRVFIAGMAWCIWPPILVMFLSTTTQKPERYFIIVFFVIGILFLSRLLARYDSLFWSGAIIWAPTMASTGFLFELDVLYLPDMISYTTQLYSHIQTLTFLLPLAACAEVARRVRRLLTCVQIMVRWAFIYMPFLVAGGIGAIIWSVALSLVPEENYDEFRKWGEVYTMNLSYPLAEGELVNTGGVFISGLVIAAGLIYYRVIEKIDAERAGLASQNWLFATLFIIPGVMLVAAIYILVRTYVFRPDVYVLSGADVFKYYLVASVRLAPLLTLLVGPFRYIFKLIGDIVLYMCPSKSPLSIRDKAVGRVKHLLILEARAGRQEDIRVVCHSQGTVIAGEAAKSLPGKWHLTMMGSPIDSLYRRFLAYNVLKDADNLVIENAYRGDDYIAGPICGKKVSNRMAGTGGHTNYWPLYSVLVPGLKLTAGSPQRSNGATT